MVPEISDVTWGILSWFVPALLMIFLVPRIALFGARVAKKMMDIPRTYL